MNSLILRKMTMDEAQDWKSKVGGTANQLRILLFEGYERGAWEALGYDNWTDCVKSLSEEYGISERHLWRLHAANETEKLLTNWSVGEISESVLRPLTKLSPDLQPVVYQRAIETAPNGKVTAAHVEATARVFVSPVSPEPVAVAPAVVPNEYEEMADEIEQNGYDWSVAELCEYADATEDELVEAEKEFVTELRKLGDAEKSEQIKTNGMAVHFSSESPEHYTPIEIIDAAIEVMGAIDLDPCSNSKEFPNVPAMDHYTIADNGLLMPWFGRVYFNPPYGRVIGEWVTKLVEEYKQGNATEAIALLPGRIDTQWCRVLRDYPRCEIEGRLTFVGNDDPAPFPSIVCYLGENSKRFYEVFSELGDIWIRVDEHWFTD